MNCCHSFPAPCTQPSVILESVKQRGGSKWIPFFKAWSMKLINLAKRSADSSSNLGIMTVLRGATHILDARIKTDAASPMTLEYTTAVYAPCEVSRNPPTSYINRFSACLTPGRWRLMTTGSIWSEAVVRPRYCKFDFSIMGSSQASSASHKNWKNILNVMVIGDNMPSGLYILAATPTILRLVGLNLSKYSHTALVSK